MARDLRGFLKILEEQGQLRRICALVDPEFEIAEISNQMLQKGWPGLLFENVKGAEFPVAINLLGTGRGVCWAMNMEKPDELEDPGEKTGNAATAKTAEKDFPSDRIRQSVVRRGQSQTGPRLFPRLSASGT